MIDCARPRAVGEGLVVGRMPSVFTLPRMLRHLAAKPTDCRRTGRLKWTHRMPVCEPRCPRARSGVWEPAAELLARTRVDRDWDRRDQYSAGLAELALHHTGWFDEWRRVRSGDPDVALVAAELEIDRAWEIRTAARARHVSREQFQAFHTVLRDAIPGPASGRRPKPRRSRSLAGAHRSSNAGVRNGRSWSWPRREPTTRSSSTATAVWWLPTCGGRTPRRCRRSRKRRSGQPR